MTWDDLATLATNMKQTKHTSLQKPVEIIFEGNFYNVDIIESLTSGDAFLTADIRVEDADGDQGA